MAKVTFEFDINDPEDAGRLKKYQHAEELYEAVYNIEEMIRDADKYPGQKLTDGPTCEELIKLVGGILEDLELPSPFWNSGYWR